MQSSPVPEALAVLSWPLASRHGGPPSGGRRDQCLQPCEAAHPSDPSSPTGPGLPAPRPSHPTAIQGSHLAAWLLPHPGEHHIPTSQSSLSIRGSKAAAFQEEEAVLLSPQPNFLPAGIFHKRPLPNPPPATPGRNAFPAAMPPAAGLLPGGCIDQLSRQTLKYFYKVSLLY